MHRIRKKRPQKLKNSHHSEEQDIDYAPDEGIIPATSEGYGEAATFEHTPAIPAPTMPLEASAGAQYMYVTVILRLLTIG